MKQYSITTDKGIYKVSKFMDESFDDNLLKWEIKFKAHLSEIKASFSLPKNYTKRKIRNFINEIDNVIPVIVLNKKA